MTTLGWIVLITAIAGVGGTGLGGLLGAVMRRDSDKSVSLLLSFAGGVMMAVVCFDLFPEAFLPEGATAETPLYVVVAGSVFGFGSVHLLNWLIDRRTNPEVNGKDHPRTADDPGELIHADHYHMHRKKAKTSGYSQLFWAGMVMALAIALHNMPEGMVIGASYAGSTGERFSGSGFLIAVVIAFHNIPEGMAVSVPLISGGMPRWRAIVITALSGAPTILGAILGYCLGLLSPIWLALSLSFAGGAMLYVVFGELLPEAFLMWKSKTPAVFAMIGTLLGMILVKI